MHPINNLPLTAADDLALALNVADEERRIRQRMRVDPRRWAKTPHRALPAALLRSTLLLTGGFCLGWGVFRLCND